MNGSPSNVNGLCEKLRELNAEFDREMRARGFDPAQAENVALPTELSRLYAERQAIREKLEEMSAPQSERGEFNQ